jgi:hypothetical protein
MTSLLLTSFSARRGARQSLGVFAAALTAPLAVACTPSVGSQEGNLGNGTFSYRCVGPAANAPPTDPACPNGGSTPSTTETIPNIALGGVFSLSYSDGSSNFLVAPASPSDFEVQGNTFVALKSGTLSFYASQNGIVSDYTEVTIVPIATVQITDVTSSVTADTGATHTYAATASAASGTLAGSVGYEWTSSDETVLTIQAGQTVPSPTINASWSRAGNATLTAKSAGGIVGSLQVTVGGAR